MPRASSSSFVTTIMVAVVALHPLARRVLVDGGLPGTTCLVRASCPLEALVGAAGARHGLCSCECSRRWRRIQRPRLYQACRRPAGRALSFSGSLPRGF